jgi:Xaa-Pro dipeptidase
VNTRYQLFDESTYRQRISRTREVLRTMEVDACIMIAPEHQFYFGGFDSWTGVNSPQAMIFTTGADDPTLLLRDVDLPLATESSWLEDIRTYQLNDESFPELVAEVLIEKGIRSGAVAVELQSYALPHSLGLELVEILSPVEIIDATNQIGALRLIKSDEEIALIAQAGLYANHGLEAMASALQPGITEIALGTEIENAVKKAGSAYWAIPVELSSGSRSAGCHGTPREKIIEPGDTVHAEFAGVSNRYHATAIQTMTCGPASSRTREIYRAAQESLDAGIAAVQAGVSVADVEEASLGPLATQGLEHAAMMRFGYGIGIAYRPIWLESLQISRDFDTLLQPGMAFVLHSCLEFPDENLGVILGGTYLLERSGLRMLAGAGNTELVSV